VAFFTKMKILHVFYSKYFTSVFGIVNDYE